MTNWYNAEFIGQKVEATDTNRFWFKVQSESVFDYQAGQFITFDLPLGEKRMERWRSYSLANDFDGSNILELGITYKKSGLASQYFFDELNKGDIVKFKGPDGNFVLPTSTGINLVLVATGAGIVPFRSMLQHIEKNGHPYDSVHLIFGTRKQKDILYLEELAYWSHFIENFTCSICLSRDTKLPKSIKNMDYYSGYVHQVYLEKYKTTKSNALFMLCGWTQMIDEAVIHLIKTMGLKREQVKYELFG
ncbi:MAG: FAD-dependent oxidoreductase [Bacteroidota bacterium]|nr:FAD-dependent oxidoreductase [Bacteroidota bacterium]